MNLICFPHYTCGGLLNDIFEQKVSNVGIHGGINSFLHSVGKIGDSNSVFDSYNPADFLSKLNNLKNIANGKWIGTHCWPGLIDTESVDRIVAVTTTTYRSKLYRWIRAYYHYYLKSDPWTEVSGQTRIDKERETAKNYIKPFLPATGKNVVNIEFSEIVETGPEFLKLTQGLEIDSHLERWKSINYFLYNTDIWNSTAFRRFYEAELETQLSKFYIYE